MEENHQDASQEDAAEAKEAAAKEKADRAEKKQQAKEEAKKETLYKLMRYLEAKAIARERAKRGEAEPAPGFAYATRVPPLVRKGEDEAASSEPPPPAEENKRPAPAPAPVASREVAKLQPSLEGTFAEFDDLLLKRGRVRAPSAAAIDAAANSPEKTRPSDKAKKEKSGDGGGAVSAPSATKRKREGQGSAADGGDEPPQSSQERLLAAQVEGMMGSRFCDSSDDEEYEVTKLGTNASGELRPMAIVVRTQKPHTNSEKRTWDVNYIASKLEEQQQQQQQQQPKKKSKVGRPPKAQQKDDGDGNTSIQKRPRGRPPKVRQVDKEDAKASIPVEKSNQEAVVGGVLTITKLPSPRSSSSSSSSTSSSDYYFDGGDNRSKVAPRTAAACRQALLSSPAYNKSAGLSAEASLSPKDTLAEDIALSMTAETATEGNSGPNVTVAMEIDASANILPVNEPTGSLDDTEDCGGAAESSLSSTSTSTSSRSDSSDSTKSASKPAAKPRKNIWCVEGILVRHRASGRLARVVQPNRNTWVWAKVAMLPEGSLSSSSPSDSNLDDLPVSNFRICDLEQLDDEGNPCGNSAAHGSGRAFASAKRSTGRMKVSEFNYGVSWNREKRQWVAEMTLNGTPSVLGFFDDELNAALEYDKEAKKHPGMGLNFI